MPPKFKVYGYAKYNDCGELTELSQVSLCFSGAQEMSEFGEFVLKCAKECSTEKNWDHDHFFEETKNRDNIVVALLDDSNK